ncbi:hypothetical protein BSL78_08672 [Apostichopus japonicus]|uniref:Uncharacterized protein n=1 Tax=Stichopus japonicus TaxID=307972 RepID=A0A2G8L2G9_STIJA|nr:hypothetical protein BSL78_08672 [Apostichopus japonicus]
MIVIPLLLYYDDFETANPLGAKRGIHKLGGFYISVLSLPVKYQARLDNILLSTLVKSKFISKYGVNEVVKYVKDDLQVLSKDGLLIDGKDFAGKVRPQLFQVVGDNLGVHSLLGYVMSFSANYYCRFCKGHRSVLQKQMVEQQDLLRTQENYRVDIDVNNVSQTGIRATSVLSEIEGYHVVENLAVDIMHDFAEGIVPLEMHLIIQRLIETRVFTLEELNSRILSYNYGFVDKKNKPNPFRQSQILNPSGASGQTAAQMVCLAIHLPLMIGDKINSSCEEWDLYLLLVEILKIVMSQSISMPATYMLKSLIKDHHELFLQLFPQRNLTPKQHIIIHYPRIIRELGPLRQYSSIRFEGKHKLFKQFANICNNFQNISKTLATKYQLAQCYDFLIEKSIDSEDVILSKEVITTIGNLEYSEKVAARLSCGMEDEIVVAGVAELHGYEFRESATVVMIWTEEGPTFGEVVCVLVRQKSVFLVLKPLKTLYYERHLQAYAVQHGVGTDVEIMQPCDLFDYRPLTAFQLPSQQLQFLPLDVSTSASSSSSCVDIEDEGTSISQDESLCDTDTSFQPPPLKREKRVHFDVRNILIENANGRRAMKNTDENKFCNKADRHSIVELCISHMMECHGDKPSSFIKGALAQAIVIAFPCLNDSDAPLGYEAWYCKGAKGRPATGYLEEHLRYRRKRIEQDFALLYPSRSNKLYQRWEKVARKVILYSQQLNWREVLGMQNTNIDDLTKEETKNLAFSLLAIIFRSGRSGKGRKGHNSANDSVNCFIDVQPEVFDIDQYVKTLKATTPTKPFVVCRGSRITPSQTYVI